jgi:hypothetical protein
VQPGEFCEVFVDTPIDVAEQRLYLRHVSRCMKSPAVLALDFFCPLPMMRPETNGKWREIERTGRGHELRLRDKREMLTPLLERRTQSFTVDGSEPVEHVSHRRFLPAQQAEQLLVEAGFESVRYLQDYDLVERARDRRGDRPLGPYRSSPSAATAARPDDQRGASTRRPGRRTRARAPVVDDHRASHTTASESATAGTTG